MARVAGIAPNRFSGFPQLAVGALHFCKSHAALFFTLRDRYREASADLGFVDIAVRNGNSASRRRKAAFLILSDRMSDAPPG
ncbi:hypothetical protein GOC91_03435 [Sinorhizobium medicae]|uniref:Uncharacterized protein n=1 Tax=Sinorhizobium medicae TaxID=110321 RepID=A0A6G1WH74_9HYPH|nr:hypothetical protein [Sinorhizobium medicae]MBO1940608.1 hypothetical protein [Sinorhizobium medicae]MBO1963784.1 hypothetical protein [Sinorhizobium medicae]MDX0407118.1 hypothetical protein [Sinorhizobium medicae]MDX0412663.1 hypothetical protein [Sinorhizobium medicae]MDX0419221.1 hypothetical protein [Sinorhizobium medicae]